MWLGYVRVSTAEQARDDRSSLQEQERVIRGMAMAKGIGQFDLSIYSDPGVSGTIKLKYRPEGGKLYADAKRGDTVIASKLDRIFRDSLDAQLVYAEFKQRGIDLILYDMGPESVIRGGMSQFFFTMLSAFATLERQRIAERMVEGKAAKKTKGGHVGGAAPYGYRIVGAGREAKLEEVEAEQRVIALVQQKIADNPTIRLGEMRHYLIGENVLARNGTPLAYIQVQRLMERVQDAD